jgi:hypothetical protein
MCLGGWVGGGGGSSWEVGLQRALLLPPPRASPQAAFRRLFAPSSASPPPAQFLEPLSRRLRTSIGLITGRWGMPLPYKVPLHMVVGDLVPVRCLPRSHPGFEAAVDEAHAAYVAALRGLYERHRAAYGWADRPLIMV